MSLATKHRYAVFGFPVKHSKSPRIHRLFAEQTAQNLSYVAMEVRPEDFAETAKNFLSFGGKGINCTVPLKELAWQFASRVTPRAAVSKAVNTLILQADGTILGDNTDGAGLITDLTRNHGVVLNHQRILVLGAGGASRGIIGPLLEQSPHELVIANRTYAKAMQLSEEFAARGAVRCCAFAELGWQSFDIIINATSASLNNELPPLPARLLNKNGCCYDLAYANGATPFVRWGLEHQAAKSLDGLGMLVEQAAEAFYLWRGVYPVTGPVIAALNAERGL